MTKWYICKHDEERRHNPRDCELVGIAYEKTYEDDEFDE